MRITHHASLRRRLCSDPASCLATAHAEDASPVPEGFTPLFNGTDLAGWVGAADNYEGRDGAIVCKPGKGGTLHTKESYGDFVVRFEFRLPPGGNNGLAIRYPESGDPVSTGMCELQVLDSEYPKYAKLDSRQYHGSAYGMADARRGHLRPMGERNDQQVTVHGSRITVELNGTTILDTDLANVTDFLAGKPHPGKDLKEGFFGFAGHGDSVMFRRIAIKRLEAGGCARPTVGPSLRDGHSPLRSNGPTVGWCSAQRIPHRPLHDLAAARRVELLVDPSHHPCRLLTDTGGIVGLGRGFTSPPSARPPRTRASRSAPPSP